MPPASSPSGSPAPPAPPTPAASSSASNLAPFAVALVAGAVALGLSAWLILAGHRTLAGLASLAATAATAVLASEARSGRPRPAFAARVLDRAFEAALLAPIAWALRETNLRAAILAVIGLGASYLASYERARGTALGYREREGSGYRVGRWAILVLGLLTGWVEASLWTFVALTVAAGAVRAGNVARQERRGRSASAPIASK
jgi:hypothetical protein